MDSKGFQTLPLSTSSWSTHLSKSVWSLDVAVTRKGSSSIGYLLGNGQDKRGGSSAQKGPRGFELHSGSVTWILLLDGHGRRS